MALVSAKIKKDAEAALLAAFTKEFGKEASADPKSHAKMAAVIAEVAVVLVKAIQTEAEVIPGIGTAGSPAAQTSVTIGKIL